jgi:hypothetical protein
MNPKLRLILVILGIVLLILLIPKPYFYSYHSDCHPYISSEINSGWCVGIIYPVNEEVQNRPDLSAISRNDDFCYDTKKGFECRGYSIFKSGIAVA